MLASTLSSFEPAIGSESQFRDKTVYVGLIWLLNPLNIQEQAGYSSENRKVLSIQVQTWHNNQMNAAGKVPD